MTIERRLLPTLLAVTCLVAFLAAPAQAQNVPPPPDVAAAPADAERTSSGLASVVLVPGTGTVHPTESNSVTVHYTGWTTDGRMFDTSGYRPSTFTLARLITGWGEGLQLMVVGEKRRFWIPEHLAYRGEREPYGMLVFDVDLFAIR